jgi:hypothetical protein
VCVCVCERVCGAERGVGRARTESNAADEICNNERLAPAGGRERRKIGGESMSDH